MKNSIWREWKRKCGKLIKCCYKERKQGCGIINRKEVLQDEVKKRGYTDPGERRVA